MKLPTLSPTAKKWILGLVAAIASYILGSLTGGCTPAQLNKVQQSAALSTTLCAYIESSTDPELAKAREACKQKADIQAILKAASDCKEPQ
jgi:hypothetical protein